jgi:hypothetical protein
VVTEVKGNCGKDPKKGRKVLKEKSGKNRPTT